MYSQAPHPPTHPPTPNTHTNTHTPPDRQSHMSRLRFLPQFERPLPIRGKPFPTSLFAKLANVAPPTACHTRARAASRSHQPAFPEWPPATNHAPSHKSAPRGRPTPLRDLQPFSNQTVLHWCVNVRIRPPSGLPLVSKDTHPIGFEN